jgi:hypothetical protein
MILQGLKPRIFDQLNKSGRKWLQELPAVVWSLRTTPSRATGFTPFFLAHGAEAVLPTDLEYGSPRVRGYDEGANQRAREDSLDQLDEARLVALMHSVQMSKLDTLRLRIDLNYMITKFHNHWAKLRWILAILRKTCLS